MTLIRDLITLPEQVRQRQFVLRRPEGVARTGETLRNFVVTPQLVRCFDGALGFIRRSHQQSVVRAAVSAAGRSSLWPSCTRCCKEIRTRSRFPTSLSAAAPTLGYGPRPRPGLPGRNGQGQDQALRAEVCHQHRDPEGVAEIPACHSAAPVSAATPWGRLPHPFSPIPGTSLRSASG